MKNEGVVGVIEQLIEKQTQSDIKMMELEEKRMQLEERILEREAQQRREDREFQMKFFQMLMGHSYYPAGHALLDLAKIRIHQHFHMELIC